MPDGNTQLFTELIATFGANGAFMAFMYLIYQDFKKQIAKKEDQLDAKDRYIKEIVATLGERQEKRISADVTLHTSIESLKEEIKDLKSYIKKQ